MKALKTIIKENENKITTGCVFLCFKNVLIGRDIYKTKGDGIQVPIKDLSEKELNKMYNTLDWFIEDGDLCLKDIL